VALGLYCCLRLTAYYKESRERAAFRHVGEFRYSATVSKVDIFCTSPSSGVTGSELLLNTGMIVEYEAVLLSLLLLLQKFTYNAKTFAIARGSRCDRRSYRATTWQRPFRSETVEEWLLDYGDEGQKIHLVKEMHRGSEGRMTGTTTTTTTSFAG